MNRPPPTKPTSTATRPKAPSQIIFGRSSSRSELPSGKAPASPHGGGEGRGSGRPPPRKSPGTSSATSLPGAPGAAAAARSPSPAVGEDPSVSARIRRAPPQARAYVGYVAPVVDVLTPVYTTSEEGPIRVVYNEELPPARPDHKGLEMQDGLPGDATMADSAVGPRLSYGAESGFTGAVSSTPFSAGAYAAPPPQALPPRWQSPNRTTSPRARMTDVFSGYRQGSPKRSSPVKTGRPALSFYEPGMHLSATLSPRLLRDDGSRASDDCLAWLKHCQTDRHVEDKVEEMMDDDLEAVLEAKGFNTRVSPRLMEAALRPECRYARENLRNSTYRNATKVATSLARASKGAQWR
eukprot:TRINITY_DN36617_c0_g1_i1.p1 TRINITY_DN36617_c0_g1~~TRINITY_DN36617_c0_g1_i1.p1  ORF type:complete len:352 (+),score=53.65 TRINITY_DN36617_c0_g1_i1:107-1162(+)